MKRVAVGLIVGLVIAALSLTGRVQHAAAGTVDRPMAVTPYVGFNPILTRAPYVTDLTQTSAYVNWATSSSTPGSLRWAPMTNKGCAATVWTPAATPVPTALPGPVPTTSASSPGMTPWGFSVVNGAGTTTLEFQSSVDVTGLSPGTTYCYAVFSTDAAGAVDLLRGSTPDQTFTTLDAPSSTTPLTFDVIGDTGENYAYTSASNGDTPFTAGVNPDEAAIYNRIGVSGAKFLLIAGDIGYSGGTASNYGDLEQTGTQPEVSNVFGPSYFPQTGGIPTFAADGNHGQNVTTLRTWPTPGTAAASGGTYAYDSYTNGTDDISGTFPDDWYAFSTGDVRIYVLDGAWSDGTAAPLGDTTGGLCSTPAYCRGYQADADEHWQTTSPEYKWLSKDLLAHPGGIKFAVFHYPLRSDNATQPSDPYLQNSGANPNASTSLEALLSANGVDIAFNGHAHTYQRYVPKAAGQIISYVTGGGGGVLEPVLGGTNCKDQLTNADIYAIGWAPSHTDPTMGTGSYCGPAVNGSPTALASVTPTSAAEVYNFLKVTVTGDTVVVDPTNAAGTVFDPQTYTFDPPLADPGFENGLTGWSPVTGVTVQSQTVHSGHSAAQFASTGGQCFALQNLAISSSTMYAQGWFDMGKQTTSTTLLGLRTRAAGTVPAEQVAAVYVTPTGQVDLRNNVSQTNYASTTTLAPGSWHKITLGVNEMAGTLEVWVDGQPDTALHQTGQVLGSVPLSNLQVGDDSTGRTYDWYADDLLVAATQPSVDPGPGSPERGDNLGAAQFPLRHTFGVVHRPLIPARPGPHSGEVT